MHGYGVEYFLLTALPVPVTFFILFAVCFGAVMIIREKKERHSYTVARSSFLGIAAFIGMALMGVLVIQRGTAPAPWMTSPAWRMFSFCAAAAYGWAAQAYSWNHSKRFPKVTLAVTYHNLLAAPLQLYAALLLTPVALFCGGKADKLGTALLFGIWFYLVLRDQMGRRSDEREWMINHGLGRSINA